jgi:glutathione S-transferase
MKSDEVFFPPIIRLMGLQATPSDPVAVSAREAAADYYRQMQELLQDGREFLAGPYGFADIAFYMAQIFADRMGAPMPQAATHLLAWRERMGQRSPLRQVAGAMGRYLLSQQRPLPDFLQRIVDGEPA